MEKREENDIEIPGVGAPSSASFKTSLSVQGESKRPQYVLESHEDEVYHEIDVGALNNEPEYCAFFDKIWVFNRAMKWQKIYDENIICYAEGGDLPLTGTDQVSAWFSDPENIIVNEGLFSHFTKKSTKRRRDCAVLPAFQFNVDQHPLLELTVSKATDAWQFCVFVKGRSGPPMICSGWKNKNGTVKFDIAQNLRKHGYNLHFAELHFVIGTWASARESSSSIRFNLRLIARSAIIPCLSVIRTIQKSRADGVTIGAVVLKDDGEVLHTKDVSLTAVCDGEKFPMKEKDGIWMALLNNLEVGEYNVKLICKGLIQKSAFLNVRVTDGQFFSYNKTHRSLAHSGKDTGPLSGSYQGMFFFRDVGLLEEKMVQGQKQWDDWDRSIEPGEHWHYWEALTEKELDERFSYLRKCGWKLLHISQHWGIWEKLDAGGRIAPHGAEQLALYLRVASRHGLAVLQALSHYPYGDHGNSTKPFRQYFEAGFKNDDWTNPKSPFTELFHNYLRDYVTLFKDETALFAMSTSGEGDIKAESPRVNDTCRFVTSLDKNHIFLSEPIHRMKKLPHEHYQGWMGELYGSRIYWIGLEIEPEIDLGVEFKFMQLGQVFMAEGSWPCPPKYAKFKGIKNTWAGTLRYRNRVRDSLYLGLVYRCPIILTWDEQYAEDEHIIFNEIASLVDWQQPFLGAPIALRVGTENVIDRGRKNLFEYEDFFTSIPLSSRYILLNAEEPESAVHVIDARKDFRKSDFVTKSEILTDKLDKLAPLRLSKGYRSSYLWSSNKKTLLAYVYNSTKHLFINAHGLQEDLAGNIHRLPESTNLMITIRHLPVSLPLHYRVYDLNDRIIIKEGEINERIDIDLGKTHKDYFILVTPLK